MASHVKIPAGEKITKGETLALSGGSVILVSGDGGVRTGTDALKGVTVQAKVLGTVRASELLGEALIGSKWRGC